MGATTPHSDDTSSAAGTGCDLHEYRRRRLAEKHKAMRKVRNTLLVLAMLAGLWFLVLLSRERSVSEPVSVESPVTERLESPEKDRTPPLILTDAIPTETTSTDAKPQAAQ